MGISIPGDILVTGFDNAPYAVTQSPTLTTVDNKIMDLGYNAIYQAIELVKTGKVETMRLPSSLICRNSCGCDPTSDQKIMSEINELLPGMTPEDLLNDFKNLFMRHYIDNFYSKRLFEILDPFLLHF